MVIYSVNRFDLSNPQTPTVINMWSYLVRRIGYSFLILAGVLILTFVLFRVAAGDPAAALLGKNPSPEEVESLRESLGSDKPLFYGKWKVTEQFTNADFSKGRTLFPGVNIEGNVSAGHGALTLSPESRVVFRRNFARENTPLRIEIEGENVTLTSSGGAIPLQNNTAELADAPEEHITLLDVKKWIFVSVHFQQ